MRECRSGAQNMTKIMPKVLLVHTYRSKIAVLRVPLSHNLYVSVYVETSVVIIVIAIPCDSHCRLNTTQDTLFVTFKILCSHQHREVNGKLVFFTGLIRVCIFVQFDSDLDSSRSRSKVCFLVLLHTEVLYEYCFVGDIVAPSFRSNPRSSLFHS